MFAKEKLNYSAIQLPDRVEMTANDSVKAAEAHLNFMRKRHSVRDFVTTPVPQAVIDAAITAAGSAPSGANHQPWHFVAISSPDVKHQIRLAAEEEEKKFYEECKYDYKVMHETAKKHGIKNPILEIPMEVDF